MPPDAVACLSLPPRAVTIVPSLAKVRRVRAKAALAARPVPVLWAVSCAICNTVGPVARARDKTARSAGRGQFELRTIGGISGWMCGTCCRIHDAMRPPATRAECEFGPRPCPALLCRYHLAFDVSRKADKNFKLAHTCALDFARDNPQGATLREVGALLGMTREGSRYVELSAKAKVRALAGIRFDFLDEDEEKP